MNFNGRYRAARAAKNSKTKSIYFGILLLGGPSPPSQLVPNQFNWSPNTVFSNSQSVFFQNVIIRSVFLQNVPDLRVF